MRAEMGKDPTRVPPSQLNLPPGFRFYPTDEELVVHYLCRKAACEPFAVPVIAEVELYKFDPWDLPEKALFGEKEWYFFSPRDRKYPNGSRPNRAAGTGYWKATGTDKPISTTGVSKKVGVKKALVFYKGKAPKGVKTNWIMHEYRLADSAGVGRSSAKRKGSLRLDDWVLCRIYKKSSSATSVQVKAAAAAGVAGIKAEQSESSCLDDVLASLSDQLDDQVQDPIEDVHTALVGADNHEAASFHSGHGKSSSDLRASMRQLQEKARMVDQFHDQKGSNMAWARADQHLNMESSNLSSIENSPLEYSTTSKEEEDMAVESTFNSLAGLPLTQLLNTSINTSNLSYSSNPFYGLDLGLPSPCSMLASGAPSYGGSLIDPDNGFFQPLGWDSSSVNRINFPS